MEELIKGLVEKVGLSEEKAEAVAEFLKDNASKVPEWLSSSGVGDQIKDRLPGGLGNLF